MFEIVDRQIFLMPVAASKMELFRTYICSTTHNALYENPRLYLILEVCQVSRLSLQFTRIEDLDQPGHQPGSVRYIWFFTLRSIGRKSGSKYHGFFMQEAIGCMPCWFTKVIYRPHRSFCCCCFLITCITELTL